MKKSNIFKRPCSALWVVYVLMISFFVGSCSEDIDDSAYAIKVEPTMADYINADTSLTLIKQVFERVRLGKSDNASTLMSVISARGNYTLFAPADSALRKYCVSITGSTDVNDFTYEQAQLVAFSCLIDNGSNSAYESVDFPTTGTFQLANLNDRLLTSAQDSLGDYVVGGSVVVSPNHEVSNGYIHVVGKVIAPSAETVSEMIQAAPNLRIMGNLLRVTGYAEFLNIDRDLDYENDETLPETRYWSSVAWNNSGNRNWAIPRKRYLGFTGFVEPDSVFIKEWSITTPKVDGGIVTNWDIIQSELEAKVASIYPDATSTDLTSRDNALNRFVAYHFLKGKMAYNKFVHHFSENNYSYGTNPLDPQSTNYSVDVWDYYTTLEMGTDGRRGLIKVLQIPTGEHEIYLNRISKYDTDLITGTYLEESTLSNQAGVNGINIKVNEYNGSYDNNASNGFYYPIDHVLIYDNSTRQALSSERMRIDVTTMTPELISNNFRGTCYEAFVNGYFENILNETEGTEIYYLQMGGNGASGDWRDFQGDEYLFSGQYDFVLRLPPVPSSGTYEIRMGASNNELRGMCQIYFGDSPDRTIPVGLPFDLRQNTGYSNGASTNPDIPFILDKDLNFDIDQIQENEKDLRTHGYMKAPKYFWTAQRTDAVRNLGSNANPALRKIITVQDLDQNKTYYLRFKSALKKTDSQFFVDYFEIVPRSVYNGVDPEDVW